MIHRITLTESELQALAGLIDAGVRATGLRSAPDAARLLSRIEAAEQLPEVELEPTPCVQSP
ncbi:MAG: hypothetical protein IPK75_18560 [Acidobacteria bacterium]|nr:hypothetical protein [Acidobacteriota bacterium]